MSFQASYNCLFLSKGVSHWAKPFLTVVKELVVLPKGKEESDESAHIEFVDRACQSNRAII